MTTKGRPLLGIVLGLATIVLAAIGTLHPVGAALAYSGGQAFLPTPSNPELAVRNIGEEIKTGDFERAHGSFANKAEFTQQEFQDDLYGYYPSVRSYATLDHFDVQPMRASASDAQVRLVMYWSTVIGTSVSTRELHVVRAGDRWAVEWPYTKRQVVPPQVIPVNYLRWDVIYPGGGDDWGAQGVEAPHIRIVDMHPVQRADGVVVMGELLNEDVVPAYVSVSASLLRKDKSVIGSEGSFDKISHVLLPKQVTPFFINFPDAQLSDVSAIDMKPFSTLVPASADPVITIDGAHLNSAPGATLTGQLINQSGQVVNVAHVLGTFYDKNGQLIWVADQYVDEALLPQTPVPFLIHIPEDLARNIASERAVVSTFTTGGLM